MGMVEVPVTEGSGERYQELEEAAGPVAESASSDGVFAAIFQGESEKLGSWKVEPTKETPAHFDAIPLRRDETLYFVVASGATENFDSFRWNPGVRDLSTGQTWVASEGFHDDNAKPTSSLWQQLAQALLASNEFAFID